MKNNNSFNNKLTIEISKLKISNNNKKVIKCRTKVNK